MAPPVGGAEDSAFAALFHPFGAGVLAWPSLGRMLFMRARAGVFPKDMPRDRLVCQQSFKPSADQLVAAGLQPVVQIGEERFPLVMLLPSRQREESRALLARAILSAEPGGSVVASVANNEGARSAEADLARLLGVVQSLSKHKCRVFWGNVGPGTVNAALVEEWAALDASRPVAEGRFLSRPGLFAWSRIDAASALLVRCLPDDLAGRGADLGAGFGYLAAEVLTHCAKVQELDLYEAEARGLDLARHNLAAFAGRVRLGFHWHDVTRGLNPAGGAGSLPRYDFIVSNPPFHQGRADQPEIGRMFIVAAADALLPGGRLWLVANRHLPYEQTLAAHFATVRCVAEEAGFKVIEAVKGKR